MTKFLTTIAWSDVPHLSEEAKRGLLSSFLPHERDARTKGVPALGSGAIYPVDESEILCDPFEFPAWFRHSYALDVGWNRTAALWQAYSPEEDVMYIYAEHYRGQAEPAIHAAAIKARGDWIPGVVDPASRGRSQADGTKLFESYRDLGLQLSVANNAREAGLLEVWQRLSTGRIKVFRHLQSFLGEYRIYRRDDKGAIVKENDHLMDTLRYLAMSGMAVAKVRPFEQWPGRPGMPQFKRQGMESDYDPYAAARNITSGPSPDQQRKSWMPGSVPGWR